MTMILERLLLIALVLIASFATVRAEPVARIVTTETGTVIVIGLFFPARVSP